MYSFCCYLGLLLRDVSLVSASASKEEVNEIDYDSRWGITSCSLVHFQSGQFKGRLIIAKFRHKIDHESTNYCGCKGVGVIWKLPWVPVLLGSGTQQGVHRVIFGFSIFWGSKCPRFSIFLNWSKMYCV